MLLGDGSSEIGANIARQVSADEALSYLDDVLKDGLIPLVGRAPIDNLLYGVSFRGKLLTICFCCRCCCTILKSGRYLPKEIHESLVPLEGVKIVTDPNLCTLCGLCVDECFMDALSIVDGSIVRDGDRCKACGRCITVCPEGAIGAEVDNTENTIKEIVDRIREFVDFE
jgi:UDP-glucose 4-epimerase